MYSNTMGKYNKYLPRGNEVEVCIANELAEANRLKRLELKHAVDYIGEDGTPNFSFKKEELEDKA